jgi:hypothetical protein
MQTRTVITLDDAARDLDAGKEFYDLQEEGIGLYYIDSLLSDIESLRICAGIHSRSLGFLSPAIQTLSFRHLLRH